jgi:hypothetical protein
MGPQNVMHEALMLFESIVGSKVRCTRCNYWLEENSGGSSGSSRPLSCSF